MKSTHKSDYQRGCTIKTIDCNLITGVTTLMVGFKNVEVNLTQYRILNELLNRWTSGLKEISQLVWYYSPKKVVRHIAYSGQAEASLIESILGLA